MSEEERVLFTQELAALTQALVFHYEHPGFLLFDEKEIKRMENRHAELKRNLFSF